MRTAIRACLCAVPLWAPMPAALAFGELDGGVGSPCTTFTTCSAAVFSHTWASTVVEFNNIQGSYDPAPWRQAYNMVQSEARVETTAALQVEAGGCSIIPCAVTGFNNYAMTRAQSDFGVNRASAYTDYGAMGRDFQANGNAEVRVTSGGTANSVWRDAWTFSTNGHFNATIRADGQSSRQTANLTLPSTFTPFGFPSEWSYDIKVWDVDHLTPDSDRILEPTLVGAASLLETIAWNESRPSLASLLSLNFDFASGVQYVVIAELRVNAMNGRDIDVYNTARLTDVALSNGASLSTLSGHDYLASIAGPSSVPEPGTAWLLSSALLGLIGVRRRHKP